MVRVVGGFSADRSFGNSDFLFDRHSQSEIDRLARTADFHFFTVGHRKAGRVRLKRILAGRESGERVDALAVGRGFLLHSTRVRQRDVCSDDRCT